MPRTANNADVDMDAIRESLRELFEEFTQNEETVASAKRAIEAHEANQSAVAARVAEVAKSAGLGKRFKINGERYVLSRRGDVYSLVPPKADKEFSL